MHSTKHNNVGKKTEPSDLNKNIKTVKIKHVYEYIQVKNIQLC